MTNRRRVDHPHVNPNPVSPIAETEFRVQTNVFRISNGSDIVTWEKDLPRTASMKLKRDLRADALRKLLVQEKAIREI